MVFSLTSKNKNLILFLLLLTIPLFLVYRNVSRFGATAPTKNVKAELKTKTARAHAKAEDSSPLAKAEADARAAEAKARPVADALAMSKAQDGYIKRINKEHDDNIAIYANQYTNSMAIYAKQYDEIIKKYYFDLNTDIRTIESYILDIILPANNFRKGKEDIANDVRKRGEESTIESYKTLMYTGTSIDRRLIDNDANAKYQNILKNHNDRAVQIQKNSEDRKNTINASREKIYDILAKRDRIAKEQRQAEIERGTLGGNALEGLMTSMKIISAVGGALVPLAR
jgi:hypothetical protein